MRIGIYSEFYEGNALGGREYIVVVLAELLSRLGHEIEFPHHDPDLTICDFEERFQLQPHCLRLRLVENRPPATLKRFPKQFAARARWASSISTPYDWFINIVHGSPLRCCAKRGFLIVLFPFFEPFNVWAGRRIPRYGNSLTWVLLRYLAYRTQWRSRISSYQIRTAISRYAQTWTQRRWNMQTDLLYPPADESFVPREKTELILSVGRFAGSRIGALSKRQVELMEVFRDIAGSDRAWRYYSIGSLSAAPEDVSYYERVKRRAHGLGDQAQVCANTTRQVLSDVYSRGKIFWHAAGFGDDEAEQPELSEHFGIATVDAMFAGCVPVVINKGAQPEIVEHGVNGFLWNTLDELKRYTLTLMHDESLRLKMSQAAQARARLFSRKAFEDRFISLFDKPASQFSRAS